MLKFPLAMLASSALQCHPQQVSNERIWHRNDDEVGHLGDNKPWKRTALLQRLRDGHRDPRKSRIHLRTQRQAAGIAPGTKNSDQYRLSRTSCLQWVDHSWFPPPPDCRIGCVAETFIMLERWRLSLTKRLRQHKSSSCRPRVKRARAKPNFAES